MVSKVAWGVVATHVLTSPWLGTLPIQAAALLASEV